ncbi:MAG: hypothetical protein CME60_02340 [Halobacteriovoraceae bacterium]|nr:hypothetical protein [Halobacteriovoraceae bacterium]
MNPLIVITFIFGIGIFSQNIYSQGGQVVAGDAFGKFYGKGVGGSLSGWSENNPFGINAVLSGPTLGYCQKNIGERRPNYRNSRYPSSSDYSYSSDRSGRGQAFDPNKDYAEGMEGLFERLKDNASNYCSKDDRSSGACSENIHGGATPKDPGTSIGRCWKYVKIALHEAGLVDHYLGSESAIEAHNNGILKNNGFCELDISDSNDAPVGSIMIYEWTESRANAKGTEAPKHGHIEVKTGENEYISDYVTDEPIDKKDSTQRKFAAAYVPGPCSETDDE